MDKLSKVHAIFNLSIRKSYSFPHSLSNGPKGNFPLRLRLHFAATKVGSRDLLENKGSHNTRAELRGLWHGSEVMQSVRSTKLAP